MSYKHGKSRLPSLALFAILLLAPLGPAWSNFSGVSGFARAETNCASACHSGSVVTSHTGGSFSFSASIEGPTTLEPGASGAFTVKMTRTAGSGAVVGGFGLSASGGALSTGDSGVRTLGGELVHAGPRALSGSTITWSFNWSAASAGSYTLFVCTNPADGFVDQAGDGPPVCDTHGITVAAVIPDPGIAGVNAAPAYTEGADPVLLDSSLTVSNVASAQVRITGNLNKSQDRLICPTTPLTCSYDTEQGRLSLSGAASASTYETALEQVRYRNLSENPSTANRTLTYTVTNGTSVTATLTLTVNKVNDAPVAVANSFSTGEDGVLEVATPGVLNNDTDVDDSALTASRVALPSHGTLVLNANGGFRYTPEPNYNGGDSFTYRANDGEANSNTVTVTLTVQALNDAPVAVANQFSTSEDTALNVPAPGVLGNDTDVDGLVLSASLVAGPENGSLVLDANGSFLYTPAPDFNGPDAFTYRASDGTANSNTATVSLTVTASPDAPDAAADSFSTDEDSPREVAAPGVLANDTDPEGGALTAVMVSGPSSGSLVLNADGSFRYVPAANFNGSDAFTYRASNGAVQSDPVTVMLGVAAINDAPAILSPAPALAFDSRPFAYSVVAADVDDPALAFSLSGAPTGMSISTTGRITWTPPSAATTSGPVTVRVADGGENGALPAEQVFTLTVRPDSTVIALADINGNGAQDLAVMIKDGAGLKLYVKDGKDGTALSTADFGPARGQAELAQVGDLNGDGRRALAILSRNLDNDTLRVDLRDPRSGRTLGSFPVLSRAFEPISVVSLPDPDGSGSDQIAVLARHRARGTTQAQILDAVSGAVVRDIPFLSRRAEPISLQRIDDRDGNARPELVVLARDTRSGASAIEARDASTGNLVATPRFSRKLRPIALAVADDLTGNGAQELVMLGRESGSDRVRVAIGDLQTGTVERSFTFLSKRHTPRSVLVLPDQNGNQVLDIAVLASSDRTGPHVEIRDGGDGTALGLLSFLGRAFHPSGLARIDDVNGGGVPELVVLGTSPTRVRSQSLDAATATPLLIINYP